MVAVGLFRQQRHQLIAEIVEQRLRLRVVTQTGCCCGATSSEEQHGDDDEQNAASGSEQEAERAVERRRCGCR